MQLVSRRFPNQAGGCRCRKQAVLREWPFTLGIDATERSQRPDQRVILQGIVDLIIPTAEVDCGRFQDDHP